MCQNSHNIDLILDEELRSRKDKKSKTFVNQLKTILSSSGDQIGNCSTPMRKSGSHNSGNDAFMTGYYFLFYLILNNTKTTFSEFKRYYTSSTKFKNKIFLSGKAHPLIIQPSIYARNSKNHKEKIQKIQEGKDKSVKENTETDD